MAVLLIFTQVIDGYTTIENIDNMEIKLFTYKIRDQIDNYIAEKLITIY
jgi:hypothetical protein